MPEMTSATRRKRVKNDIESKMMKLRLESQLYQSKLAEYMELYDHCEQLQARAVDLSTDPKQTRIYLECIKEIRQIRKSMFDILNWLGVTPECEIEEAKEIDYEL